MSIEVTEKDYEGDWEALAEKLGTSLEDIQQTRSLPESKLQDLVRAYLFGDHSSADAQLKKLLSVLDLAVAPCFEALSHPDCFQVETDDSTIEEKFEKYSQLVHGEKAKERLLEMLAKSPPSVSYSKNYIASKRSVEILSALNNAEAKSLMIDYLSTKDTHAHEAFAESLMSYGTDDLISAFEIFLVDPDSDKLYESALKGALMACQLGRGTPLFIQHLWQHCLQVLRANKPRKGLNPFYVMVEIDQKAFLEELQNPEHHRADSPFLNTLLSKSQEFDISLPLPFLEQVILNDQGSGEFSSIWQYSINQLKRQNHPNLLQHVEKRISESKPDDWMVLAEAWRLRFELTGTPNTEMIVTERFRNDKTLTLQDLSRDERIFDLLHNLRYVARYGMVSALFDEQSGKFVRELPRALKKIGARKHVWRVRALILLYGFGPIGEKSHSHVNSMGFIREWLCETLCDQLNELNHTFDTEVLALKWEWGRQKKLQDPSGS